MRERQVVDRWWLVWIVAGIQIVLTNLATQWLIWRDITRPLPHVLTWGAQVLVLAITVRLIHRRRGGQRSQRERFIWWIWSSFLIGGAVVALMNTLLGLPIFFTAPVIPILAAFAWSMMTMAVHPAFSAAIATFVLAALAMALLPSYQFIIYGACWFVTLEVLGLYFRPRPAARSAAL